MGRRMYLIGTTLIAVALAAVAFGSAAVTDAAPSLITVSKQAPMPAEQGPTKTVTARCPKGKQALSGGWDARGAAVTAIASYRSSPRAWTVSAVRVTNDLSPVTLKVFAYCVPRRPIEPVSIDITVPEGEDGGFSGETSCPDGRKPLATGFQILNFEFEGASALPVVVKRTATGVKGTVISANVPAVTMRATAYCGKAGKLHTRKGKATFSEGARTIKTGRCAGPALAGGFANTVNNDRLIVIDRFQRVGSRWVAHMFTPDTATQTVRVFAHCP